MRWTGSCGATLWTRACLAVHGDDQTISEATITIAR